MHLPSTIGQRVGGKMVVDDVVNPSKLRHELLNRIVFSSKPTSTALPKKSVPTDSGPPSIQPFFQVPFLRLLY